MSSLKGSGIPALLDDLRQLVGEHGDVWVVGAQNSGAALSVFLRPDMRGGRHGDLLSEIVPPVCGLCMTSEHQSWKRMAADSRVSTIRSAYSQLAGYAGY